MNANVATASTTYITQNKNTDINHCKHKRTRVATTTATTKMQMSKQKSENDTVSYQTQTSKIKHEQIKHEP